MKSIPKMSIVYDWCTEIDEDHVRNIVEDVILFSIGSDYGHFFWFSLWIPKTETFNDYTEW